MTTATVEPIAPPVELEPDNAARLAVVDAMYDAIEQGDTAITLEDLFNRAIGRLRVLVPRELHNHQRKERGYLEDKVATWADAGLLAATGEDRYTLASDPQAWIRYPDDSIRRYTPRLIAARERLDAVNASLRASNFDVTQHLPHHEPSSPEFQALVRSMQEHGFFKERAVFRYPDGAHIDGESRIQAAEKAGVDVKWLKLGAKDPEARLRRRDTALDRILRALDLNATRLTDEQRQDVLDQAAQKVHRGWAEIEADLDLTRPWRTSTARSYTPTFEVTEIAYGDDGASTVIVTGDHKFHIPTLIRVGGLHKHKANDLKEYVSFEEARYPGGGPAGNFAHATDLVQGLEAMIAERRERKRKAIPEWEVLLSWLQEYVRKNRISQNRD